MDGRDIGTVVLPDADVKLFLTAAPEARAHRRWLELVEKGEKVTEEEVLRDVLQRDYNDTHRETAPLRQADDAVLVDTTHCDLEESYQLLLRAIRERM
jgi:cytidylate kinase